MLSVRPGPGLRIALEDADRVDSLFLERASIEIEPRLADRLGGSVRHRGDAVTETGLRACSICCCKSSITSSPISRCRCRRNKQSAAVVVVSCTSFVVLLTRDCFLRSSSASALPVRSTTYGLPRASTVMRTAPLVGTGAGAKPPWRSRGTGRRRACSPRSTRCRSDSPARAARRASSAPAGSPDPRRRRQRRRPRRRRSRRPNASRTPDRRVRREARRDRPRRRAPTESRSRPRRAGRHRRRTPAAPRRAAAAPTDRRRRRCRRRSSRTARSRSRPCRRDGSSRPTRSRRRRRQRRARRHRRRANARCAPNPRPNPEGSPAC